MMEKLEVKNSIRASVKLQLNECPLTRVSARYPELEYSIHDKQVLHSGGVIASLIVKQTNETDAFFSGLNHCKSVSSLNFLYFGKEECKARIDFDCTSCIFMRLMEDLRISTDYIHYKNNSMVATFSLKDHEEFRGLLKYFKRLGVEFSVLEVVRQKTNGPVLKGIEQGMFTPILTVKQREVLRHAYRSGYFDRDKKVNLGDIAEHFNVSPATVGVHMRAGLKKILKTMM